VAKQTDTTKSQKRNSDVGAFLDFLARDMESHPGNITPLSSELLSRVVGLVGDVKVDIDECIDDDVDL
jgi:hypothetical protein